MVKVKDKIRIIQIDGEPKYSGKVGIVEHIDGQVEEVKPKSIKFEEWCDE